MAQLAVGIDLGGTQVRAALMSRDGRILKRAEVATTAKSGPQAVVGQMVAVASEVMQGTAQDAVAGIGVCAPGPLDTERGVTLSVFTLADFVEFPLKAALQAHFAQPVHLENDAISAAIGEWRHGAAKGLSNLVYVTVSTGIGGGVIIANRVLRGRMGMAGHIGHMVLVKDGVRCNCGNPGCFEAYGSGPFFTARAAERAARHQATLLGKSGARIDSRAVFQAARAGDELALDLVREEAAILGTGFVSLAHLFSPDMIVMGGGISNEFDALAPMMRSTFERGAMPGFKAIPIVPARLGGNSGLIGAASLVFEEAADRA